MKNGKFKQRDGRDMSRASVHEEPGQLCGEIRKTECRATVGESSNFDSLPNSAHVRLPMLEQLYGCSSASIWRHVKTGLIPAPRKFGARITAWNVGELRAALVGESLEALR